MVHVEAADPHAVTPARFKPGRDTRNYIGVFDEVLSSVRQSTFRLADLAGKQEQQTQASPREQWMDNAREQNGTERQPDSQRHQQTEHEPSRADRLSANQQRQENRQVMDNTDTGREQKQVRPENETRAQRMEQASRNEYMDETAEKNSEQTENNPAVAPIENASGSNSQNETNVQNKAFSGSKHDAGHTQPGGAASFGQQVNNGQQAAGNNAVPGAGQVQVSGNGIKTAGSRTSGRQMDGQFLRSQQMGQASAKNVENTGQKGSSALDFHNLLEGAGKARTRNLQTKMQSGHQPSGQNSTGQTVKLNEPGSIRELANVVRSRIGSNNSSMLLRLDPPELGKLRIDVQMRNGQFTVRLEAQTQAGHDALQSRLTDLRHTLEQQGIQLNQVEVELKPPAPVNESSNARMHDQNAGQQSGAFENENNGAGQSSGDPNHFSSGHPQSDVPTEQEQVPEHAATTAEEPPQPIAGPANKGVDLVI